MKRPVRLRWLAVLGAWAVVGTACTCQSPEEDFARRVQPVQRELRSTLGLEVTAAMEPSSEDGLFDVVVTLPKRPPHFSATDVQSACEIAVRRHLSKVGQIRVLLRPELPGP